MKKTIMIGYLILLIVGIMFLVECDNEKNRDDNYSSPTPTYTPSNGPDIIPGVKLYNLYINDEYSTCVAQYGEPDSIYYIDEYFEVFYYSPFIILSIVDINDNGVLEGNDTIAWIGVSNLTNWYGTTAGGNGIGSTRESIINEFGPCEESSETYCLYWSMGILWSFYDDVCFAIMICPPEEPERGHIPNLGSYFSLAPNKKRWLK